MALITSDCAPSQAIGRDLRGQGGQGMGDHAPQPQGRDLRSPQGSPRQAPQQGQFGQRRAQAFRSAHLTRDMNPSATLAIRGVSAFCRVPGCRT